MVRSRLVLLLLCTGCLLLRPGSAFADLVIQVESSTTEYAEPEKFELVVILQNDGDAPFIVLPRWLRRNYAPLGGGTAQYSPYPGPPIKPWKDAFLLRPGQTRRVAFRGMGDGDGVWKLEPGRYELSVDLSVSPDAVEVSRSHVKHLGGAIWQGSIRSPSIRVTYSPTPAA